MPLLTLTNIHHAYGTRIILDGVTVSIEAGEKVGLVGRNGTGKTTLMKAMRGDLKPDSGTISLSRGARVGYLSQDPDLNPEDSVRDAAEGAFAELHALHQDLHRVYDEMATADEAGLERLLRRQAHLESAIAAAGGYAIDHRIDAMLHGLGFTDDQFPLKVRSLSGGQKGRLGLARLLLESPDLLLLDEPTNHLDIAGREWLEAFLRDEFHGAVLLVSHDRWLLDRVVDRIVEIDPTGTYEYPGNYAKYVELRRERHLVQSRVYEKQQDRIRQEQAFIDRYRAGQRARQAKGREAKLERYKSDGLVDRPLELDVMHLDLPPAPRSGDQVVVARGIAKRYGARTLFERVDLTMMRGERIGIIGPNGTGKTTLVRCLLGDLPPDEGEIRLGSRVDVGYYRQLHDHIDQSLTVWRYLQSVIVGLDGSAKASEQQARDLAGAFLFSGGDQEKVLSSLSGGERSRAVLAGLVAGAHNLLVLDEPTNHLDIPSSERLERALSPEGGFEGSLILISHDRALLESLCTSLIVFGEGSSPVYFQGRYSEWHARRRAVEEAAASAKKASTQSAAASPKPAVRSKAASPSAGPLAKLKAAELEARIERCTKRCREIDHLMGSEEVYTNAARCRELGAEREQVQKELDALEEEWLRREEG